MRHADAIVVGEADEIWPRVVADAARGRMRRRYEARPPSLEYLANVPRELVASGTYLTRNSILATRGCNRLCEFCYRTSLRHSPLRTRPVLEVLSEIERMPGSCVVFLDDNLAADHAYAKRLFSALRGAGKVWMGAASIDLARDETLPDIFAESGCCSLFIGIESIHQCNLDEMHKESNDVALYEEHVRRIRTRGIMVNGSFVFGFDGDGADTFDQTVDWALRCNVDTATFHILTPYPGTALFSRLERAGRITDRDWSHYDTAHVVFEPARMSAAELQAGYESAYDRFYKWPAILKRICSDRWGRFSRLMLNVGYKRMNRMWPTLGRWGLASLTFGMFVGALRAHRRRWKWQTAEPVKHLSMEAVR